MTISVRVFVAVFAASLLLTAGSISAIMSGGVAVAMPAPSDGQVVISFDHLEGEEFTTYPSIKSSESCDNQPYVVSEIQRGTIENLEITRRIAPPLSGDGAVEMKIEAGEAEFRGLTQLYTNQTGNLTFDEGQEIESQRGGYVEDRFQITADSVTIEDGVLATEGQFINQISLEDTSVSIETNPTTTRSNASGTGCLDEE
jgi:hypothetical protein